MIFPVCALITVGLFSILLVPKSLLELLYFKDRQDAKETIKIFVAVLLALSVSSGFSVLINYMG